MSSQLEDAFNEAVERRTAELRAALEFYANADNYVGGEVGWWGGPNHHRRDRSARFGMIRGKQSKEAVVSDGLVAGGTVRIHRDGADPVGQVTAPADGSRVGTRELLAGNYTASDEAGNSVEFTVEAAHDLAVLPVQGASATSRVEVHRLGGGLVDEIPAEPAKATPAARKAAAKKPAAKKKAAKR